MKVLIKKRAYSLPRRRESETRRATEDRPRDFEIDPIIFAIPGDCRARGASVEKDRRERCPRDSELNEARERKTRARARWMKASRPSMYLECNIHAAAGTICKQFFLIFARIDGRT